MASSSNFHITDAKPEQFTELHFLFLAPKTKFFGRHRKKNHLEDIFFKSYVTYRISIQISERNPNIIGYAEVSNNPNLPALTDDLWLNFLDFHYCCNLPLTITNTIFLNTFVYNDDYNPELLRQLLYEIFHRENKVKYILVLECPDYQRYPEMAHRNYHCLEIYSTVFYPKCFSVNTCANTQKLHVIMRDNLLPQMRYRKALPEDNDDIVDIANHDRPDLKQELGEYYIAEELLSDSKSQLIVTEINHITAGFIWLSDNVNLLNLLENYNLQSFGNLVKLNIKERFKEKIISVNTAQKQPLEKLFTTEAVNQIYKYVGEITHIENVSNLSLCSHHIESHEGRIVAVNVKGFIRELVLKKWAELSEKINSYDYYVQIRRREFGFYYNIPDNEKNVPYDAHLNAFVIELSGLKSSHDPRRIFRFLLTAFAAYPDKDYCLLSLNVKNRITPVLHEILKYFVRVDRRPGCLIDEHLFITHRSAVYGDLSLYPVQQDDIDPIKSLIMQENPESHQSVKRTPRSRLSTIADRVSFKSFLSEFNDSNVELGPQQYDLDHVLDILKNIFEDPYSKYKCYTIKCGDSSRSREDNILVGFVIVRPFNLSCFLKKHFHHYKENENQNFIKAEVVTLKLHPFFCFQSDFIYRELSRQTGYRYFYYFRPTDQYYLSNDLVTTMQPLEPRRVKKRWFNYLDQTQSSTKKSSEKCGIKLDLLKDKVAVFMNNLRPTVQFGNQRNIVILGFNDICKAFLRLMIFSWHNLSDNNLATINCLPLLNITVVCSPGIVEADHENGFKCKTCTSETCWIDFKNSDDFIKDVCERMDLRIWIKFVNGNIKSIDTEHQCLKMQSGCEIYYETLLLMCGTDFGVPERIFGNNKQPPNYSHINNRFDKIVFYHKLDILLKDLPRNVTKSIIVYGCHIRAFEFINFLLKHGIQSSEIHLVMPYTMENRQMGLILNNSTEDTRIEEILREMIEDLGVKIYDQLNLCAYTLHDDEENLREVSFKKFNSNEVVTVECDLFVSYYEVFLATPLLEIFQKSNIDTMGNFVLVKENYETSVKNIYAMGNFIKHQMEPNHQYRFVCPQEAAEKIIYSLGLIENVDHGTSFEKKFSKNSYFQAQLPMDHLFVKVTTPKRYLANHLDNEYGFPLVTYNEGEFSRVRLNEHGMVEEIVLVTKRKINFDFLKFFCGRHELLLNNLKSRWYLKYITNFIDFFQEPWTELLMHEEFESLRLVNKSLIKDTAKDILKKNIDREARRKLLISLGKTSGLNTQLKYAFTEFLSTHREDFQTNFALPEDFSTNTN